MASSSREDSTVAGRKLVVLGIPWETDTEALRSYMDQFGPIDDIIVMKDRATGKSRGFGYVTFATASQAETVLNQVHTLKERKLEVKMATPKEEMKPAKSQDSTRIFVARIPQSVDDEAFRSYFADFGTIMDSYMPKDPSSKNHRGIGFVTFDSSSSVDKVMAEKHEIGGAALAVDRATPKEETGKSWARGGAALAVAPQFHSSVSYMDSRGPIGYVPVPQSAFDGYARPSPAGYAGMYGGLGTSDAVALGLRSTPAPIYTAGSANGAGGSLGPPKRGENGSKVFIGKLPGEATVEDLRNYFERFGPIEDIYIPKDANKGSHRGFGFITFAEEEVATFVSGRPHKICGRAVVVDRATPQDGGASAGRSAGMAGGSSMGGGAGGPVRGSASSAGLAGYYTAGTGYDAPLEYQSYISQVEAPVEHGTSLYRTPRPEASRYRPY